MGYQFGTVYIFRLHAFTFLVFSSSMNISWSVAVNWGMVGSVRVMCMHVCVVCECVCIIMYAVYACMLEYGECVLVDRFGQMWNEFPY